MKRTILCLILALLCLVSIPVMGLGLQRDIQDTELDHSVISGDPGAAEGLTLGLVSCYRNLFWKQEMQVGQEPTVETDFFLGSAAGKMNEDWFIESVPGGREDLWKEWYLQDWREEKLEQNRLVLYTNSYDEKIDELFMDLLDGMEPGQEQTVEVDLSSYYDCYPYYLGGRYISRENVDGGRDFIRRPVEEGHVVKMTVRKDSNNSSSQGMEEIAPEDMGYVGAFSAPVGQGCFVAQSFDERVEPEESWLPWGFGLFYVPGTETAWEEMPGITYLQPQYDERICVVPLNLETDRVVALDSDPEGESVHMVTRESGACWLTSLSADGTVRSRLQLPEALGQEMELKVRRGFLVLRGESGCVAVWSIGADGAAALDFCVAESLEKENWNVRWWEDVALAYRNGSLAVAFGTAGLDEWGDRTGRLGTVVQILDASGMVYAGVYTSGPEDAWAYNYGEVSLYEIRPWICWTS